MKLRRLGRRAPWVACLLLAAPATADRPSLIDLQAAVDGLVSPPPPAASGTIRLVNSNLDASFPLVELVLSADVPHACSSSCIPTGPPSFSWVRATFEEAASLGALAAEFLASASLEDVFVDVPTAPSLLRFRPVAIEAIESHELPGRVELQLTFGEMELRLGGGLASWDTTSDTGSGCSISPETHVDLAGNGPGFLQPRQIEADFSLGFPGSAPPSLRYARTPNAPCYLYGGASRQVFPITFLRLWDRDAQFRGEQRVVEIEIPATFITHWTLRVTSGVVREEVEIAPGGTLTTREFSPVDASIIGETSADF